MGDTEELGEVVSLGLPHPEWRGHIGHLPHSLAFGPALAVPRECHPAPSLWFQRPGPVLLSIWTPFLPPKPPPAPLFHSIHLPDQPFRTHFLSWCQHLRPSESRVALSNRHLM